MCNLKRHCTTKKGLYYERIIKNHSKWRYFRNHTDRPKANAIDAKTSFKMGEVFLNFRDDPSLRVAIITGAGEIFLCGLGFKSAAEGEAPDADFGPGGFAGLTEIFNLKQTCYCCGEWICVWRWF